MHRKSWRRVRGRTGRLECGRTEENDDRPEREYFGKKINKQKNQGREICVRAVGLCGKLQTFFSTATRYTVRGGS